jgi:glutaredoxin 3
MNRRHFPSFLTTLYASVLSMTTLISPIYGDTPPPAPPTQASVQPAAVTKKQAEVIIYSSAGCGPCRDAKKFLDEKVVSYKVIDVQGKKDLIDEMERLTGKRTVPQILINGKHVGSYSSLVVLNMSGALDDMLFQSPEIHVAEQTSSTKIQATPVSTSK